VNIGLPAAPEFTGAYWNQLNPEAQAFQLNFIGSSNASYSVWASTNLVNWTRLGIVTNIVPGQYGFIDADATNWPQRFYRLAAP